MIGTYSGEGNGHCSNQLPALLGLFGTLHSRMTDWQGAGDG